MTKAEMKAEIATDLQWIEENDPNLWSAWLSVDEDVPDTEEIEVQYHGDETVYWVSPDFALAVYGQSEPRLASWLLDT